MSRYSSKGTSWEKTRAGVLANNPLCEICRVAQATSVDHIVPKARGGTDDPSNLQASCKPCNLKKGSRVQTRQTWASPRWFPHGLPS